MKFKIDENLPASLLVEFQKRGYDACSVVLQGLSGASDEIVWERVCREGYFLIPQDLDFSDTRKFSPGSHPGILLLRLKEPGRTALREKLVTLLDGENVEAWKGCFLVATDSKLRIQRPA